MPENEIGAIAMTMVASIAAEPYVDKASSSTIDVDERAVSPIGPKPFLLLSRDMYLARVLCGLNLEKSGVVAFASSSLWRLRTRWPRCATAVSLLPVEPRIRALGTLIWI
jgi:hypothetical protein